MKWYDILLVKVKDIPVLIIKPWRFGGIVEV
jgi:hypothetical protein